MADPKEKKRFKLKKEEKEHAFSDGGKLFPRHRAVFILYAFFCLGLLTFGIILIIMGNWANSGYFSLWALVNKKWPNVEVEDETWTFSTLEFFQLSCWIIGFIFLLFVPISLYVAVLLYNLMFTKFPWKRESWNKTRRDADQILVEGKVRDKSLEEQKTYLTDEQKGDMEKYLQSQSTNESSILTQSV